MNEQLPGQDLAGEIWFITGASAGFGRALALEVLARGGRLVATARDPAALECLVAEAPERVVAARLDVTSREQIEAAKAAADARFGAVDVLVNNAGIGYLAAIEEGSDAEVRRLFDANVFGLAAVTRAFLPSMRARRCGTIVNISSIVGFRANAGVGYYAASKWAVEALSEALSKEIAPFGLKVLIVEPGPFRTDFAGRSLLRPAHTIDEYEAVVAIRAASQRGHAKQSGDPVRAASLIVDAVHAPEPQLRLILGASGYASVIGSVERRLQGLRQSEELAPLADFPAD